uniref:Uncharacterized protein n=1 Tax=Arundo donax TaxID=35708 RepID=A0A0A9BMN5_ARUDO
MLPQGQQFFLSNKNYGFLFENIF